MNGSSDVFNLIDDVMSRINHRGDEDEALDIHEDAVASGVDTEDDDTEFEKWRQEFLDEVESVTGQSLEELILGYPLRNLYSQTDSLDEAVQRFLEDMETPKSNRVESRTFREWSHDVDAILADSGGPSLEELRDSGFMSASSLYTFFLEYRVPSEAADQLVDGDRETSGMSLSEIDDFHKWINDLDLDSEEEEEEEDDDDDDDHDEWEDIEEDVGDTVPPGMADVFEEVKKSTKNDPVNPNSIDSLMSKVMVRGEKPSPKEELTQRVVPDMLDIVEDDMDVPGAADIMEQASQALRGFVDVVPEKGQINE
jgi:hypothetical protein